MNSRLSVPPGEERDCFEVEPQGRTAREFSDAPHEFHEEHELPEDGRDDGDAVAGPGDELATGPVAEPIIARARLLWGERVLVRRALGAGLLAGVLAAWLIPSEYQSTVQLMPPDNSSYGGLQMLAALAAKSSGAMGSIAGDALGVKSAGSLFIGILRSRTVADRLVERFHLQKVYRAKLEERARKRLSENTAISEDRKSGIITLTVSGHERRQARALATAYVEELNRLAAELSTSSAHRERLFLEGRLAAVKRDLDQATRELGEFSSQNATLDLKDEGRAMLEAAAALQGELIAAESERQSLEAVYTPENYRVRAVAARVSELQKQLRQLGGRENGEENAGADEGRREGTESNEGTEVKDGAEGKGKDEDEDEDEDKNHAPDKNRPGSDSLYPSLRKLPLLATKYAELYRRTKIEEAVFETLTQQYEVAKVQEAKETPSVKMLDEASLPESSSFPPRMAIAVLGAGAGFFGAAAWIFARKRWRDMAADDPKKRFSQEVFDGMNSAMPWAHPKGSRWHEVSHQIWLRVTRHRKGRRSPHADDPFTDSSSSRHPAADDAPLG